jgi:hypothetical protein
VQGSPRLLLTVSANGELCEEDQGATADCRFSVASDLLFLVSTPELVVAPGHHRHHTGTAADELWLEESGVTSAHRFLLGLPGP